MSNPSDTSANATSNPKTATTTATEFDANANKPEEATKKQTTTTPNKKTTSTETKKDTADNKAAPSKPKAKDPKRDAIIREGLKQLEPKLKSLPQAFLLKPAKDLATGFLNANYKRNKHNEKTLKLTDDEKIPRSIHWKFQYKFPIPYSPELKDKIDSSEEECLQKIKETQDFILKQMRETAQLLADDYEKELQDTFMEEIIFISKAYAFYQNRSALADFSQMLDVDYIAKSTVKLFLTNPKSKPLLEYINLPTKENEMKTYLSNYPNFNVTDVAYLNQSPRKSSSTTNTNLRYTGPNTVNITRPPEDKIFNDHSKEKANFTTILFIEQFLLDIVPDLTYILANTLTGNTSKQSAIEATEAFLAKRTRNILAEEIEKELANEKPIDKQTMRQEIRDIARSELQLLQNADKKQKTSTATKQLKKKPNSPTNESNTSERTTATWQNIPTEQPPLPPQPLNQQPPSWYTNQHQQWGAPPTNNNNNQPWGAPPPTNNPPKNAWGGSNPNRSATPSDQGDSSLGFNNSMEDGNYNQKPPSNNYKLSWTPPTQDNNNNNPPPQWPYYDKYTNPRATRGRNAQNSHYNNNNSTRTFIPNPNYKGKPENYIPEFVHPKDRGNKNRGGYNNDRGNKNQGGYNNDSEYGNRKY